MPGPAGYLRLHPPGHRRHEKGNGVGGAGEGVRGHASGPPHRPAGGPATGLTWRRGSEKPRWESCLGSRCHSSVIFTYGWRQIQVPSRAVIVAREWVPITTVYAWLSRPLRSWGTCCLPGSAARACDVVGSSGWGSETGVPCGSSFHPRSGPLTGAGPPRSGARPGARCGPGPGAGRVSR